MLCWLQKEAGICGAFLFWYLEAWKVCERVGETWRWCEECYIHEIPWRNLKDWMMRDDRDPCNRCFVSIANRRYAFEQCAPSTVPSTLAEKMQPAIHVGLASWQGAPLHDMASRIVEITSWFKWSLTYHFPGIPRFQGRHEQTTLLYTCVEVQRIVLLTRALPISPNSTSPLL